MKHLLETNMEKGMLNYNETGYDGVTHTWDIIQTEVRSVFTLHSRRETHVTGPPDKE